jgi:hypothetical protein
MAAVTEGANPGRTNTQGSRQSPARGQHGRSGGTSDPTSPSDQTPSDIFGFAQTYSTGARGSTGAPSQDGPNGDVTVERGQLDPGLAQVSGSEITSTGAPGSQGARNSPGGDTVTYTDPFGYLGQEHRESSTAGRVSGSGDWTQANDMGYDGGPTLPVLQNARPTSSGAGQGRIRGAGKGL